MYFISVLILNNSVYVLILKFENFNNKIKNTNISQKFSENDEKEMNFDINSKYLS